MNVNGNNTHFFLNIIFNLDGTQMITLTTDLGSISTTRSSKAVTCDVKKGQDSGLAVCVCVCAPKPLIKV